MKPKHTHLALDKAWIISHLITESSILAEEKEEYDVTGTKVYQESCNTLGIIPASYFVRTLQAQEPQINMSHHGVGPKGAKAIAIALTVSLLFNLTKILANTVIINHSFPPSNSHSPTLW